MIILKSAEEIERIRCCCAIVAEVLQALEEMIHPGVTTAELDAFAAELIRKRGAKAAFKGYKGYPKSTCTSVNDVVVHGIPGDETLKESDIISVDIGVYKDGFYGDSARTYAVGDIDEKAERLLAVTEAALAKAIEKIQVGNHLQDISATIQNYAEEQGFSVVRDFVGHGIGRDLHEDPPIPNFGKAGYGPSLEEGMVFAIEPMINEGKAAVKIDKDGWTARTRDGKRSAHFEHSVAVTAQGPWVLSEVNGEGTQFRKENLR